MGNRRPLILSGGSPQELTSSDELVLPANPAQLLGATTKQYVDSYLDYNDVPAHYGLTLMSFDPGFITASAAVATGVCYLTKLFVKKNITINNICTYLQNAGSGISSAATNMAAYDSTGTRIAATGDQSTAFASTGFITASVGTPVNVTGGPSTFIWLAWKTTATTMPNPIRTSQTTAAVLNMGLTAATSRVAQLAADTANPCPSSFTPSSLLNTGTMFQLFMGIS